MNHKLVLASASPRRRALLEQIGAEFTVAVSDADEEALDPASIPVHLYVQELALMKAAAVAKEMLRERNTLILSADTVVYAGGTILGKPKDEKEAFRILKALSGKAHQVYTGFCIMRLSDGKAVCDREVTKVRFRALSDERIRAYIRTGEPMDKAGAYGIQEKGALLIEEIQGDYANVVGLPISKVAEILDREFSVNLL